MTKSRKIGLILAIALVFVLFATSIVPLSLGANTASAVAVTPREEWTNSYSGTYYDNLNTEKVGAEFRSDLANLITTTHTKQLTYADLKEVYKTTDVDPNNKNNVIWFYTGDSVPYTGAMDTGEYPTNREHVWPKMGGQAFPEQTEAGSDAHHVRPLNTGLNNTRSNNHFGEVPQTSGNRVKQSGTYANYGSDSNPDSWCYQATVNGVKLFYPAEGYRGATARILFYLQVRWGDKSNLSFALGNAGTKVMGNVDVLLKWHLEEPPTDEEIRRNEAVYGIQGNRNPFIDHPEYAEMIYCNDGKSYNGVLKEMVEQYGSYIENKNEDNNGGTTTDPTPPDSGSTTTPGNGNTTTPPSNGSTTTPPNNGSSAKPNDTNNDPKPAKDPDWTVIISVSVAAVVLIVVVVVIVVVVKKNKKKKSVE